MLLILLNRMNCPPHSSSSGFLPQKKRTISTFVCIMSTIVVEAKKKKNILKKCMKEDPFQRTKFQQKNLWVTFLILFWGVTKYLLETFSRRKLIFTKSYLILFQFLLGLTLQFWVLFLSHWTVIKWSNSQHKKSSIQWKQRKCVLAVWIILKKTFFHYPPLINCGGSPTEWIWCNSLWCNWSMYATVSLKICTWKKE